MNWTDAIDLRPTGDRRFSAHVDEAWTSLQGAHGGIVAALAVAAAERVVGELGLESAPTVRAATFGYASGNVVGDLEVEVEVIRQGRNMVTTHTRTSQAGKTTTVGRLHHSGPWPGMTYSDASAPPERPEHTVRLEFPSPAHLNNVEAHLHPDSQVFGGSDRSEWTAWCRPLHGGTFDIAWLTMFGDFFPPAVFTRSTGPLRAVTIEYSLQVHSAAGSWSLADDEYLTAHMHTFHSSDGFAVEDGWIHLPDGTLLATVRQTRLAG